MTRALALLLLALAAVPARAQSGDPEPTPAERFAEVERTAWGGTLENLARIGAMLDHLDALTGTRMRQDSLAALANAASATRGALFVLVQFTATRVGPDGDAALQPLAEAALGLVDLLGQTAFDASEDARSAGRAAKALDGPARAAQMRGLADALRRGTTALGIALP